MITLEKIDIKPLDNFAVAVTQEFREQVEMKLGAALPKGYRDFLELYGLSMVDAQYSILDERRNYEETVEIFYGAASVNTYDLIANFRCYTGRIPSDLLPIGADGGGNQICLGIKGEVRGKVYFWDHEGETIPGGPMPTNNLYLIANSFEEFLDKLEPFTTE